MNSRQHIPRVLLVGNYDMDNFGDVLFLLITEQYLSDAGVVPGALFDWDMTAVLDRRLQAYGKILDEEEFDAIWTVGGEAGGWPQRGFDLESAFWLSAPDNEYEEFERNSPDQRKRILNELVGDGPVLAPYIPSPLSYPPNSGTITVLNSAGIAHILDVPNARRNQLISLLRGTTFISVRDKESSELLASLGIEHRLMPDCVHAIRMLRPAQRNPDSDVAIFQVASSVMSSLGTANVAQAITQSQSLRGLRLRIMMAGTCRGSDSAEHNNELIAHILQIAPSLDVELIEERRPLYLVEWIRNARVVIGSSLHLRIVACSYGVPRISLSLAKPTRYARFWDPGMPYDVPLDHFDEAIGNALVAAERSDVIAHSNRLSRVADDGLKDLADRVVRLARTQDGDDKAQRQFVRQVHHRTS